VSAAATTSTFVRGLVMWTSVKRVRPPPGLLCRDAASATTAGSGSVSMRSDRTPVRSHAAGHSHSALRRTVAAATSARTATRCDDAPRSSRREQRPTGLRITIGASRGTRQTTGCPRAVRAEATHGTATRNTSGSHRRQGEPWRNATLAQRHQEQRGASHSQGELFRRIGASLALPASTYAATRTPTKTSNHARETPAT
jgi:hypothetical protein